MSNDELIEATTCMDDSPEFLAQLWCFHLTRRKFGLPRDLPQDIAPEMENMIDMGFLPKFLREEILRKGRDRGEFVWQFKERIKYLKFGDPRKPGQKYKAPETEEERQQKIAAQRSQAANAREGALGVGEFAKILKMRKGGQG